MIDSKPFAMSFNASPNASLAERICKIEGRQLVALLPAAVVFLAFHHAIKHTDKYWRCKEDAI